MGEVLRVLIAALLAALTSSALGQTTGSMRVLIAPGAAIDGPTYEEYQRCLAGIGPAQDLTKTAAARQACKDTALRKAYRVPDERSGSISPRTPSVDDRTQAQRQKLEKFK